MASTFGHRFRVTTFGESHGPVVGAVVDGCPAGLALDATAIQAELDRRRPGQSALTSPRNEPDRVEVLSGVFEGTTLGTPILLLVRNVDARSADYAQQKHLWRPSHADFTYDAKYGVRDWRGGGRASARETVGRVLAGSVARQLLATDGIEIVAWVDRVADIEAHVDRERVTREAVESHATRCPDPVAADAMARCIDAARAEGDTVGGVVRCVARGVAPGLGEPVFDKLEADLGKALLSLPAARGMEIGSGFEGTRRRGSEHNDPFVVVDGVVRTSTNHSGGVQGGISNGMPVVVGVGFKPVATIQQAQATVDRGGRAAELQPGGRHDPCVLPRAVPIVEAMVALVLCDHWLLDRTSRLRPPE